MVIEFLGVLGVCDSADVDFLRKEIRGSGGLELWGRARDIQVCGGTLDLS